MDLVEYFDPYNIDHIKAYKKLQDTGMWPKGFLPENIYIPAGWDYRIKYKIADAWIDYMERKESQ